MINDRIGYTHDRIGYTHDRIGYTHNRIGHRTPKRKKMFNFNILYGNTNDMNEIRSKYMFSFSKGPLFFVLEHGYNDVSACNNLSKAHGHMQGTLTT